MILQLFRPAPRLLVTKIYIFQENSKVPPSTISGSEQQPRDQFLKSQPCPWRERENFCHILLWNSGMFFLSFLNNGFCDSIISILSSYEVTRENPCILNSGLNWCDILFRFWRAGGHRSQSRTAFRGHHACTNSKVWSRASETEWWD
jgi:hypothetical protein